MPKTVSFSTPPRSSVATTLAAVEIDRVERSRLLAADEPPPRAEPGQPARERRIAWNRNRRALLARPPVPAPRDSCGCCRCRRAGRRPRPRCGWERRAQPSGARPTDVGDRARQAHDRRRARLLLERLDPPERDQQVVTRSTRRRSGARCRTAPSSGGCSDRDGRDRGRAAAAAGESRAPSGTACRPRNDHQSTSSPSQERRSRRSVPAAADPHPVVVGQHLVDVGGQTARELRDEPPGGVEDEQPLGVRDHEPVAGSPRPPALPAGRPAGSGRRPATRSPARAP